MNYQTLIPDLNPGHRRRPQSLIEVPLQFPFGFRKLSRERLG